MRISYNWLKDYVDLNLPPVKLAELLTLSGSEVESIDRLGPNLDEKIIAAEIKALQDHADGRLKIAEMNIGGDKVQVVTGAPNAAVGQKVPLALTGAALPGGQIISVTEFEGLQSHGMLCSEQELGLGDDSAGLMVLPEDIQVGMPLVRALQLDDTIIELELYPNRPDCMSVIGIAREVAAITGQPLRRPLFSLQESKESAEHLTSVKVLDTKLCPMYTGRVITDVKVGPSPLWLQQRIMAGGMRPINNVVDITNFVLLEMGQPLHAFDLDKLTEGRVVVRRANAGEAITTLDGEKRPLDPDVLVIADAKEPACIAGIMGGAASEVTKQTKALFLAAAIFDGVDVRRTSRRLGLRSEASARFEKGLDPKGVIQALDRAAALLVDIAGASVCKGVLVHDQIESRKTVIELRPKQCERLLGIEIPVDVIIRLLKSLEFGVTEVGSHLEVRVPSHRLDIELEADLIEEVARLYGYDQIPVTLPKGTAKGAEDERLDTIGNIRHFLVGAGLTEVITYSFDSFAVFDALRLSPDHNLRKAVRLQNPLTEDMEILRTTMIGQMLGVARHNASHQQPHLGLFQLGAVYIPRSVPVEKQPDELQTLGILLTGEHPRKWGMSPKEVDFFDLKGIVEAVLDDLQLKGSWERTVHPTFHPGRSALVHVEGVLLGIIGEIHPEVQKKWELPNRVYVAELNLEPILSKMGKDLHVKTLPRFPFIARDFALLAPTTVSAEQIVKTIWTCGGELLKDITLFDVYEGRQIPQGHRSLAYSIRYQAEDRTLTDGEVETVEKAILSGLKELGIKRR